MDKRASNTLSNDEDTKLLCAELFSIEQLKRHAVTLAGLYKLDPVPGVDKLLPRLADNERVLLAAYDVVVHYRYRDTFYHITIKCRSDGAECVKVDGVVVNNAGLISLVDDRQEHYVEVVLA